MNTPIQPVPLEQFAAFGRAVCERLGLDPAIVSERISWEVLGDDDHGHIDLRISLPADEILHMFNTGKVKS